MATNQFSTTLSQKDRDEVMAAIATIKEKLPFLIDLTPEQRQSLLKMGDKSRAFVSAIKSRGTARLKLSVEPKYL